MRIKILQIIMNVLLAVIVVDLVYSQVIRGPYYYRLSINNRIRVVPLEGKRGRILDRHGVVLADNRLTFNVVITPQEIKNTDELFEFLSRTLKIDKHILLRRFIQRTYT